MTDQDIINPTVLRTRLRRNIDSALDEPPRKDTSIRAIIPPSTFKRGPADGMSTNKSTSRVSSLTKSIDAVLDTSSSNPDRSPPAKPVRPLAKLRPSWIGPPRPERPTTPGVPAMKQRVRVTFGSPGLKPPVYILTNLSEPAWEAVEMNAEKKPDGSWAFFKPFEVEEGQYQYKFRLGPGDWWACDNSKPMVDDGHGNKNNLLVVKPVEKRLELPRTPSTSPPAPQHQTSAAQPIPQPPALVVPKSAPASQAISTPAIEKPHSQAGPLLKHEQFLDHSGASLHTSEREKDELRSAVASSNPDTAYLLMEHEKFDKKSLVNDKDDSSSSSSSSSEDADDDPDAGRPLLPHEQFTRPSSSHEPGSASKYGPTGPGGHHELSNITSGGKHASPVAEEADPNDASLEPFPTELPRIVALLNGISTRQNAPAGESCRSASSPTHLPSVRETEIEFQEAMEMARKVEAEEELEREEAEHETMPPGFGSKSSPVETEDSDFEPGSAAAGVDKNGRKIKPGSSAEKHKNSRRVKGHAAAARGRYTMLAVAVGLLVIAAGVMAMRFKW